MVWATSDTERPVPRYLFTCLQFTVPANPGPAVPSNSATPITSVPSFMREPPCACAQPLDADRAARGTPSDCIATPRREGKLRRPAPSRPARAGHWARTGRRSRDMGMRAGVMMMLSVAGPALAAAPMLDRIDVAGDQAPRGDAGPRAAPARGGPRAPRARADGRGDRGPRADTDRRSPRAPRARADGRGNRSPRTDTDRRGARAPRARADGRGNRSPRADGRGDRAPHTRTDRRGTRAARPAGAPRAGGAVTEPAAIELQGEAAHRGS